MLKLRKDTQNVIAVTPDDKATVTSFFYLFRFFHVQLERDFVVQLTPTNPTSNRYKRFIVDLPNDINLPYGDYHFYIYQSLSDGSTDYQGLVELENGKAWVLTPEITSYEITDERQDYAIRFS